jgi:hypothetical protein
VAEQERGSKKQDLAPSRQHQQPQQELKHSPVVQRYRGVTPCGGGEGGQERKKQPPNMFAASINVGGDGTARTEIVGEFQTAMDAAIAADYGILAFGLPLSMLNFPNDTEGDMMSDQGKEVWKAYLDRKRLTGL